MLTDLYETIEIIKETKIPLKKEVVNIENAFGRISATTVYSNYDLPAHNISKMDGFAVNSNISNFEQPFRIIDELFAGEKTEKKLNPNEAIRVATGAILDEQVTEVVPIENSRLIDNKVYLTKQKREFIQKKGSIVKKNDLILRRNQLIDHRNIELLASLRLNSVKVFKPINIAILSTGSELTEYFVNEAQILNSNFYMLKTFLKNFNVTTTYLGIAQDNVNDIKKIIKDNLPFYDIFITIGGTGFSKADVILSLIEELKGKLLIKGVNASPGKTFKFALLENKPFFILPGNPQSAISCTELFLGSFLFNLMNINNKVKTKVKFELNKKEGFYKLIRTVIQFENDSFVAYDNSEKNGFKAITVINKDIKKLKKGDICESFLIYCL